MRQYYIQLANQQKGPYSLEQLRQLYLHKSTPIWYEGLSNWTTVQEVPEVNVLLSTPPPFNGIVPESPGKNITPPPYQTTSTTNLGTGNSYYQNYEPVRKSNKKVWAFVLGLILVLIIGGLLYSNHSQALQVNELSQAKEQQKQDEIVRNALADAINEKNKNYRNKWKDFISFGDVRPSFGDFGGCDPFAVPIRNTTDQMLDEVDVELKYIKANGGVYKVERVVITNIPANSQKIGTGPGSSRGLRLEKEIIGVVSRGMHFCYPLNNGNPEDPYLCN